MGRGVQKSFTRTDPKGGPKIVLQEIAQMSNRQIDRQIDVEQIDRQMSNRYIDRCRIDRQIDVQQIDRQMSNRQIERCRIERQIDRCRCRIDRQIDVKKDRYIQIYIINTVGGNVVTSVKYYKNKEIFSHQLTCFPRLNTRIYLDRCGIDRQKDVEQIDRQMLNRQIDR